MNGGRLEDSLIECKANWPGIDKARQLAAHANSARGEEIIWIVGIDEKARQITRPDPIDLANWWPEFSKAFDEVAPAINDHVINVGEGKTVTALVFSTDQTPYVVKTGAQDGRAEREVPIRSGTRTRSAKRYELVRLLHPASSVPNVALLWGILTAAPSERATGSLLLEAHMEMFVDQRTDEVLVFPYHRMWAAIRSIGPGKRGRKAIPLRLQVDELQHSEGYFKEIGVLNRRDGLVVAGPAGLNYFGKVSIPGRWKEDVVQVDTFQLQLSIGVAGTEKSIDLSHCLETRKKLIHPSSLAEWEYYRS